MARVQLNIREQDMTLRFGQSVGDMSSRCLTPLLRYVLHHLVHEGYSRATSTFHRQ